MQNAELRKKKPTPIFNSQFSILNSKGFTLIEMLVVISIIAILATVSTQIMISLIRSNNKTNVLNEVKQNGSFALDLMERDIRAASANPLPYTTGSCDINTCNLFLTNQDGTTTIYQCKSNNPGPGNGSIQRNNKDLLTTTTGTGTVALSSCTFSVDPNSNPPLVTIDFTLTQPSTFLRSDYTATQNFHTSVSLRTY